jgi:hypothetical protein
LSVTGRAELRAVAAIEGAVREGSLDLDLHGLGLKVLPDLPDGLRGLRRLNLSGNRLPSLPASLWTLTGLEQLDLSGNRLRTLDDGIGQLKNLQTLNLSQNRLTELPPRLAACTHLQHLDLFDNLLSALPDVVLGLASLRSLDLARNGVVALPELAGRLPALETLDLSGNRLAALPSDLHHLKGLRRLNLASNALRTLDPVTWPDGLEELVLEDNELSDLAGAFASRPASFELWTGGNPLESRQASPAIRPTRGGISVDMLQRRLGGGYRADINYFQTPARTFEFSLLVQHGEAVRQALDVYFKQFAGTPVSMVVGDGQPIELDRLTRCDAFQMVGPAPSEGAPVEATVVLRATSDDAAVERACAFAARALDRIDGVVLVPHQTGVPPRTTPRAPAAARAAEGVAPPPDAQPVDAAVFCPPRVARRGTFLVQVYLYPPGEESAVERQATEADAAASRRATYALPLTLQQETRVDLHLEAPGLVVAEPDAIIVWRGRPTPAQFEVEVPAEVQSAEVIARVRIAVAGVPAGTIRFKITLSDAEAKAAPPAFVEIDAVKYSRAFASYSSEDRPEVLRRVQAFQVVGLTVFQDILDLDPGERWERRLYLEIDKCDVFLLFWSKAAAASEWVGKEIAYAMKRKHDDLDRPPAIEPVPLEGPPLVPPPKGLEHLNFNDPLLAHITVADQQRESRRRPS